MSATQVTQEPIHLKISIGNSPARRARKARS